MADKNNDKKLTPRAENFSNWYGEVVQAAKLAENSDVKGCMVIRPNGYAIWENIQRQLDSMFKETGHQNAYFPLLIPQSYLQKEKDHVEGFNDKHVAMVTHAGGEKLEEPYVIRPTSETIINRSFSRWVQSYRDLPLLINQWANVMRWEMRTRMFLRTTEFLWQEGHTCHETPEQAEEEALRMLEVYRVFAEEWMAMPVIVGRKTDSEKFAGADRTYSIEAMMQDKKALQAGTSHNLGQNFAKAFETMFQGRDGKQHHVWQTSWGVSTRLIGGLIMTHSDDQGLIVPPKLAPQQVAIVIIGKGDERAPVKAKADAIAAELRKAGVRVKIDDDETKSMGARFYEYELTGLCVRMDLGPKDLQKDQCVLVRRDDIKNKLFVPLSECVAKCQSMLDEMQKAMFAKAKSFRESNTFEVNTYEEMKARAEDGFLLAHWNGDPKVEKQIKDELQLTTRNRPFNLKQEPGKCIVTGEPSPGRIVFSRAY
jgi:prolyl-tRNA synthetase